MPLTRASRGPVHAAITAAYLLLVIALHPLLLTHDLSAATAQPHADTDFCTWLDHAASSLVHSSAPALTITATVLTVDAVTDGAIVSRRAHVDVIRGPPRR